MTDLRAIAVQEAAAGGEAKPAPARGQKRGREPAADKERAPSGNPAALRQDLEDEGRRQQIDLAMEAQDEFHKRKLILKIKAYASAFPQFCGELVASKLLEEMSIPQLEKLLREVKFAVAARTSGIVTKQAAAGAVVFAEATLKGMGWEVAGPAVSLQEVARSEEYNMLITECTLEYMDWIYQKPEYRLLAYLGQTIIQMDKINRRVLGEKQEKAMEPEPKKARTDNQDGVIVEEVVAPPFPAADAAPPAAGAGPAAAPPQPPKPAPIVTTGPIVKPKPSPKNK